MRLMRERVEALVEAAISTCEPENADEKATEYTRLVLRRKFRAILERPARTFYGGDEG